MRSKDRQKGFTLVETLVGVAILGVVGVALVSGMFTGYRSLETNQDKVIAESLSKSQVEYIKSQDYVAVFRYDPGDPENRYDTIDIPAHLVSAGYTVEINTPSVIIPTGRSGFELQSITVQVKRNENLKLAITFYKVGLGL